MQLMKKIWPPLKTFPNSPAILHVFDTKIVDVSVGGGHILFLDGKFHIIFQTKECVTVWVKTHVAN